jgi:hypothetical protein
MEKSLKIVSALLDGRQEMLRVFRSDSCIAATKIAIDVLAHYHILAEPLAVKVMIFNPAFVQRIENGADIPISGEITKQWSEEDGSWCLGLGYGESAPNKWPGHLVAIVRDHGWLIDLSLDQAARPKRDINVGPAAFDVASEFLRGEAPHIQTINGSVLKYMAFPTDTSYDVSPNWNNPRPDELEISEKIIERIKEV